MKEKWIGELMGVRQPEYGETPLSWPEVIVFLTLKINGEVNEQD